MEHKSLTERQKAALEFVTKYAAQHGRAPTYREVGDALGLKNPNNAKPIVDALVERGLVAKKHAPGSGVGGHPRQLRVVELPVADIYVPTRGVVSCGDGVENDEEFESEPINVSEFFRRQDLAAYVASGNSMIDAHIADGDTLFVRENPFPAINTIVVAMLDRRMVCKKLAKRSPSEVVLKSCNPEIEPIRFDPFLEPVHFRVLGELYYVFRKCQR